MRDQAMSDLTDMARLLPNVSINTDYNAMYMRGIGTAELNVIGEQAVAYILDDVYVPRLDFLKPGFLDLAQMEVMKGPQGTLYGRNATGGVIKIDHGAPSEEWEGFVSAASGERAYSNYEAAIGGPITDRIALRVALRKADEDGYVENSRTGERSRDKEIEQARVSIRADISDRLTFDASYYHLDRNQDRRLFTAAIIYSRG
jgi:iron complex outermembrane recepter protein